MTQYAVPSETPAAAFDHFGGPEVLALQTLPIPRMADDEIILRVDVAGVGVWDAVHREGEFVPEGSQFPMVAGSDAAGTVVAAGPAVTDVAVGDEVYAYAWARPKGGFYARYAVTKGAYASKLPPGLSLEQAGALGTDGLTALSGLDTLGLSAGQTLLIFGASGGLGHLALQLAKRMDLEVIAVASGEDGVTLSQRLGSDLALDGHTGGAELTAKIREIAPGGVAGLLLTATSDNLDELLSLVRPGGRVAHPNGVQPPTRINNGSNKGSSNGSNNLPNNLQVQAFDGEMSRGQLERLNDLIAAGPFEVHIAQTFALAQADKAHERLEQHYLGKLALNVTD